MIERPNSVFIPVYLSINIDISVSIFLILAT